MISTFPDSSVEELRGVHFYSKNKVISDKNRNSHSSGRAPNPRNPWIRDTYVTIRDHITIM